MRNLRLKDIEFKLSSTGKQYAEVHIKISKTKPRSVPLIFSIPYVKDWIDSHPTAGNPNSYLFVSLSDRTNGQKLSGNALYKRYASDLKNYFSRLSKESSIPENDRAFIKNMLTKPWIPYILRHSSLTAKSMVLKEATFRSFAGWSNNSNMPNVYIHYYGNESCKSLLEEYQNKQIGVMKGKTCSNCSELNKPNSKFCVKCRMVLTYDAYSETIEEKQQKESEVKRLQDKYEQDIKTMREEIREEMKKQLAQLVTQLKPELIKEGFSTEKNSGV